MGWISYLSCHMADSVYAVAPSTISSYAVCVSEPAREETWTNLDGTYLTTYRYRSSSNNRTHIYIAPDYNVVLPSYTQSDPSLFDRHKIEPTFCSAQPNYISGTRWYTNEMPHLRILQNYDYFVKMDIDIMFLQPIQTHLLQDMHRKGAVFAHTAEYKDKGSRACTRGIRNALQAFVGSAETTLPWKKELCSQGFATLENDSDQYYSNFIIGRVQFWQSPLVLELGRFLSEFQPGFYKYRWADQIFYHFAMGLFLQNFTEHVLDYTDLSQCPTSELLVVSHG